MVKKTGASQKLVPVFVSKLRTANLYQKQATKQQKGLFIIHIKLDEGFTSCFFKGFCFNFKAL
ncbi:hypothetical protein ACTQ3M_09085 [Oscillospiraceae bacterium LCP25S3_E10]|nr:hypothetical protein [Ruminococcus sp.]